MWAVDCGQVWMVAMEAGQRSDVDGGGGKWTAVSGQMWTVAVESGQRSAIRCGRWRWKVDSGQRSDVYGDKKISKNPFRLLALLKS